jgi:acetylornithine/N-succinyldiaminopimelate aminotransferase
MTDSFSLAQPVTSALMPLARRANLAFSHGEGVYLYGLDGKKYLDFLAGIAVCSLGHCHPYLVETLRTQAGKLWHCSNHFRIPEQERLAERLTRLTGMDMAYFCNSGAEANEAAFKLVRKYFDDSSQPERYRIISVEQAFHGRTMAALAATGQEKYLKGFYPKVDGFDQVAYGDLAAMEQAIGPTTAAIIIEPVQGEGGLRVASDEYLLGLRALCDRHGLLLLFDQVQCGIGRTGKFCSHSWCGGVKPDVITFAKGLGGGIPIGVCLSTKQAALGMTAGVHGTTFGGNPLVCAVANAVLDILATDEFLQNVQNCGTRFGDGLKQLAAEFPDIIVEHRGRGLLTGIQCKITNTDFVPVLREHGLLSTQGGDNCLRLVPPLIVKPAEIDLALEKIRTAAHSWRERAASVGAA